MVLRRFQGIGRIFVKFLGYLYSPIDCDCIVSSLVYIIMFVLSWYAKYGGLYLRIKFDIERNGHFLVIQGLEDFRRITARNTTVKVLGVVSIFLFVKTPGDLYLYVFPIDLL